MNIYCVVCMEKDIVIYNGISLCKAHFKMMWAFIEGKGGKPLSQMLKEQEEAAHDES